MCSHSHSHGVVLPPSLLSHCLLSHTLSHPCHPCEHSHGVVLPPSLLTHCSERTCAPTHTPMVSYYHQVYPLTLTLSSLSHTLPWCRTTTKSTHSLSHCLLSHTHSPTHVIPVNTPMVSYYHQVYPLTALRELVLPLTLPWCRTTTKCTLTLSSLSHTLSTHVIPVNTPMVLYYHQVYSLTALRELVLPLTLPWCRTTTKSTLTLL